MSAASPPPPPDPNRFNPFASTCGSSPSGSSRRPPLRRRSKTVANPESPLRWRREPLTDVTNLVLGRRENWTGRLHRVPTLDGDASPSLSASRSDDVDTSSSPATPSRIPRRSNMLRRTRSAAPGLAGSSSPGEISGLPSALAHQGLSLVRDSAIVRDDAGPSGLPRPVGSTASTLRRLARSLTGAGDAPASLTAGPSDAASGSRRRIIGGLGTLPPVREDGPSPSPPSTAPPPATPVTRSRTSRDREADEQPSSENERRLRRRRTIASTPIGSGTPTRKGLR